MSGRAESPEFEASRAYAEWAIAGLRRDNRARSPPPPAASAAPGLDFSDFDDFGDVASFDDGDGGDGSDVLVSLMLDAHRRRLEAAAFANDSEVVAALVNALGRADGAVGNAVWLTARNGHTATMRRLLECGGDACATGDGGETALIAAADGGHVECMRLLLRYGADATAVTAAQLATGATALMRAAGNSSDDDDAAAAAVLAIACSVDCAIDKVRDSQGRTALMRAAAFGNVGGVRQLLALGADPTLRCDRSGDAGKTAAELACAYTIRREVRGTIVAMLTAARDAGEAVWGARAAACAAERAWWRRGAAMMAWHSLRCGEGGSA